MVGADAPCTQRLSSEDSSNTATMALGSMPSPHRHGAEKRADGDRQRESQEYGGKYRGESPNGANAVLNTRIPGGDLRRGKDEECRKCEYADSEFHIGSRWAEIVLQEC